MHRLLTVCYVAGWLTLLSRSRCVRGLTLAPIYWNSSNPMFKPSINSPVIEVQLRDEIDFVCPWDASNGTDGATSPEYYVIYQVSKKEYDSCSLFIGDRNPLMIVNCSAPEAKRRFTVIFEPYQSIPNVPEYKIGSTYYYTTTSSGKRNGLGNLNGGACQDFNMKIAFYVCCPTTVSSSTTTSQSLFIPTGQSSSSTGNELPGSSDSASQLQTPKSSTTQTSTTTESTPSTPSSTATSTVSSFKRRITSSNQVKDVSTTKITQLPQPSYQQTANCGCRKTAVNSAVIFLLPMLIFRRT